MNYLPGALVQTLNVNSMRVIQMPCMSDQQEPPLGFRAAVMELQINYDGIPDNQIGPQFNNYQPFAVVCDLTQLVQNNTIGAPRSIAVAPALTAADMTETPDANGLLLTFSSGYNVSLISGLSNGSNSQYVATQLIHDFIGSQPVFCIQGDNTQVWVWGSIYVCVTNYHMDNMAFTVPMYPHGEG